MGDSSPRSPVYRLYWEITDLVESYEDSSENMTAELINSKEREEFQSNPLWD